MSAAPPQSRLEVVQGELRRLAAWIDRAVAGDRDARLEGDVTDEAAALLGDKIEALLEAGRRAAREDAILCNIIQNIPHSVFWKDRQSRYLGANQNLLRDLGLTSFTQLAGKTDLETPVSRQEAEYFRAVDRRVMESGKAEGNFEEAQHRPDGTHTLLTSKVPLRDAYGDIFGVLGIYVDITERKRAEEELRAAKERAEAADHTKSELLSFVSHELRTPLTLILGPLDALLADSGAALSDRTRASLERIRRNAARLLDLVTDTLDFVRLEEGRLAVTREALDPVKVVEAIVDDARPAAEHWGVELDFHRSDAGIARLDRRMLERIALNLLTNALKVTPQGGTVDVAVRRIDERTVELSVADTGPGIPAARHTEVFERFRQIEAPGAQRTLGSGLGLALVKALAELLGGTVGLESEVGKGSRFFVRFPTDGVEALPGPEVRAERRESPAAPRLERDLGEPRAGADADARGTVEPGRPLLVVAEDNDEMRAYICDVLQDLFEVHGVSDGRAALEVARRLRPEVVVSDIVMPEMDGLELVARLKEDPALRPIPVVLLTAKFGTSDLVAGLEAGADDYVTKPFSPAELRARARAAARLHRAYRELEETHLQEQSTLRRLREAQEQLVQSAKMAAVGTLVAGMSHELNNPIATIRLQVESLLRRIAEDGPLRKGLLAIDRQSQRCARILKALLEFSRKKPAEQGVVCVRDLLAHMAELAGPTADGARVRVEIEPSPSGMPDIGVSRQEIETAILNLVTNALDATPAGGTVRLGAGARDVGGRSGIEIWVRDTGGGIPPELVDRIFDPFFTTKAVGKGTGLGLSLTRKIVESAGGCIEVDTTPCVGTTMRVWLPALEPVSHTGGS